MNYCAKWFCNCFVNNTLDDKFFLPSIKVTHHPISILFNHFAISTIFIRDCEIFILH